MMPSFEGTGTSSCTFGRLYSESFDLRKPKLTLITVVLLIFLLPFSGWVRPDNLPGMVIVSHGAASVKGLPGGEFNNFSCFWMFSLYEFSCFCIPDIIDVCRIQGIDV